ncbi:MAG: hypothetical protein IJT37_00930 [Lachnospiraceae bacterium]|nr:hypothetical protein [Lachnospiraceae bacterium]
MIKQAVYHALLVVCLCMSRVSMLLMLRANWAYIDAKREVAQKRRNKGFVRESQMW